VKLSVLAGDGVLLHTIHEHLQLGRPSFRRGRGDPLLGPLGQPAPVHRRVERMARFMGDGLIVPTAAGSTAYNLSAHGPIILLGSNLLAVTPVSPFRPRRWKGALVPHTAEIMVENLDADKRPLAATADFHELFQLVSVAIREDPSTTVQLLFDADHSLEERIIAEQFLS
jgi:NAD+ kinase